MTKRVAASVLWFVSVGWGLNFLAALLVAPQLPGLMIAVVVAAFVGTDPLHLFWPVPDRRTASAAPFDASRTATGQPI